MEDTEAALGEKKSVETAILKTPGAHRRESYLLISEHGPESEGS